MPFARTISLPHSALFWIIPLGFSVGTFLGYSAIEGQSAKLVLSLCCLLVLATITMSRFVQMNLFIYLFVCSIVAGTVSSILTHGFVFGGYIQPSELIKKS